MIGLLHILLTWWPVFVLLALPRLAQTVAVVVATRTKSRLDHRIPDDLPMTAGEWLAGRLAARGDEISAIVTDKDVNAYLPQDRLIQLTDETHFKADPVYWAIAAHELGHARLRQQAPIVGWLRTAAQWLGLALVGAGVGLAFGRVLYGIPLTGTLAFACFAIAAVLRVFVLVDEALASVIAYRELRANDAIDFVHLRAIRSVLVTAFLTYFVTYAAYALLLLQWPLLGTLAGGAAPPPAELTTLGVIVAAVASVACVVVAIVELVNMLAPGRSPATSPPSDVLVRFVANLLRAIPIGVLLWLVWNHRVDPTYAWCAIIAFAASARIWIRLLHLPALIPGGMIALAVTKLAGPGLDRTSRYLEARLRGQALVTAGNTRLERLEAWYRE